jgi:hypothetical protein
VFKGRVCPDIGFSLVSHKTFNLETVLNWMTSQYWFRPGFLIFLRKSESWKPCWAVSCPNFGFNPVFLYVYENLNLGNRAQLDDVPTLVSTQFSYIFMKISISETGLCCIMPQYCCSIKIQLSSLYASCWLFISDRRTIEVFHLFALFSLVKNVQTVHQQGDMPLIKQWRTSWLM